MGNAVFSASINDGLQDSVQLGEADLVLVRHHLYSVTLSFGHQLIDFTLLLLDQYLKALWKCKCENSKIFTIGFSNYFSSLANY